MSRSFSLFASWCFALVRSQKAGGAIGTLLQIIKRPICRAVPAATIGKTLRYQWDCMEEMTMKKTLAILATAATVATTAVTAPAQARGIGPGLAFGLAAGAIAAGAFGAYGYYGPGYGYGYGYGPYYGPAYYGPGYYGPGYAYYGGPYWRHRYWHRHYW